MVELVTGGIQEADFVVYLSTSTNDPPYDLPSSSEASGADADDGGGDWAARKLVVLDEGDGTGYYPPVKENRS